MFAYYRVVHIDFLNKEIVGSYENDKRFNYDVLCVWIGMATAFW
ncbi:MAG: Rpn family recombination-promoting nuclease/putative transposase [Bacteroidaceae bacterium]|nr:Rpn family recombination-promoting nuclease/putative transposase [Bacteroidaceae bacterium]